MRASLRSAVAIAVVLIAVSSASAQFVMVPTQASFGRGRTSIFVQPRVIPVNPFWHWGNGFGPGHFHGGFGQWPPGGAFVVNPTPPPIIIQNIIQQPPGLAFPAARNGGRVVIPPEFDPPAVRAPKAPKLGPAPKKADEVVVANVQKPAPRALGRADADRIAESGRNAFADGQYGRALEMFRRAAEIMPNEPSTHFLVSQAQFARGKYREAVAAIAVGLELRPDWSEARFVPRDLYWKKPAVFDDQLAALRQAATAFPDDPDLLFLLGHQLWFDGQHDEAKGFIQKARTAGKGQTPASAFQVDAR
jgi:hypothetical protein